MSPPILTSSSTVSRDLVDFSDVLSGLGITAPTAAQSVEIQRLITATSVRFANLCGRSFRPETCTDVFRSARYVGFLSLSQRPVISIASVTDGSESLSVDAYDVDLARGMLYRLSADARIQWCSSKVTVVYVAGYAQVPADVSDALVTVLRTKWLATQSASGASTILKSFSIEGVGREDYWTPSSGSISSASDIPADFQPVADTINYYRGLVIA